MQLVRAYLVFTLLMVLRTVSRLLFRHKVRWLGQKPGNWGDVRVLAALNHTSLYEPLYAGALPPSFLWHLARRGVLPVADKTLRRPIVGRFFRLLCQHVVVVTRQPDHTWQAVLDTIGPDSVVIIFPEGRMKRADGLDGDGKPMTVRGGIADILEAVGTGRMLVAYLGGLHHVQAPGQFLPRAFRTLEVTLELLDVGWYRESMLRRFGAAGFKRAVVDDLEARRERYCPPGPMESLSRVASMTRARAARDTADRASGQGDQS
ncbi:MAG: 1-acyl-sn-glycerol-3-phosphate acyltransferase [Acidobacteriota bacterium]